MQKTKNKKREEICGNSQVVCMLCRHFLWIKNKSMQKKKGKQKEKSRRKIFVAVVKLSAYHTIISFGERKQVNAQKRKRKKERDRETEGDS